jgi:hypothetical protein
MTWVIIVMVLAFVWTLLWQQRRRVTTPEPLPDPRRLLARQLHEEAMAAEKEGRYDAAQHVRLKATWLRVEPPLGQDEPPARLNPNDEKHLMLADNIRQRYAALLSDQTHPYAQCTVKPAALLPFPKEAIAAALQLFVDIGRGNVTSYYVQRGSISPAETEVVERSLQLLTTFVDAPPEDVPTDPEVNAEVAKRWSNDA